MIRFRFSVSALLSAITALMFLSHSAFATVYALSTAETQKVEGAEHDRGDVAAFDDATSALSHALPPDTVGPEDDVDAVHRLANGHWLISTQGTVKLGGVRVEGGDLVEVDADGAYVGIALHFEKLDIDALFVADDGHILLSTREKVELGGLKFEKEAVVDYDPITNTAAIVLSRDQFDEPSDVTALHRLPGAGFLLSMAGEGALGGLKFDKGDWVLYDPIAGTASRVGQSVDAYGKQVTIDGLSVISDAVDPIGVPALSLIGHGALVVALVVSGGLGRGRSARN
jgi:hypothetical protein